MAKRIAFSVISATGEEPDYPASELNVHGPTVQGWHSSATDTSETTQPQEIVIRFHQAARINRIQVLAHQYLIPERIELWIHYPSDGKNVAASTPSSQAFEYLGFISLSDNDLTKYKSRELQSVAVGPRCGTHLKLRFGMAHENPYNPHKQVALIAVNVIGCELNGSPTGSGNGPSPNDDLDNPALASICDDLSFSMYVEESIAETVRRMEQMKMAAVNDERFEFARKLKLCMTALRNAGERLGRYSLAKRQAVQQEDFMAAKLRKEQIDIYKRSVFKHLLVEKLLESEGLDAENDQACEVYAQKPVLPLPLSLQQVASTLTPETEKCPKDMPDTSQHSLTLDPNHLTSHNPIVPSSPSLSHAGRGASSQRRGESPATSRAGSLRRRNKSAPRNTFDDYEDRAVPALRHSQTNEFLRECQGAALLENDPCRSRSRLNERERRQAAIPLLVFGNEMVELFYSRQFQDREEGLIQLTAILRGEEPLMFTAGINKIARGSTLLLHRSVRDAVFSVFNHAMESVRALFVEFAPGKVSLSEIARCVDRLLPELLAKSGDPSPRIHTLAQHTILSIDACPEVREQHLVAPALSRSVGSGTHPRLALSRMQMLEQMVLSRGISTDKQSGMTCRSLSECGCSGIHHPAEPVRKVAERILLLVYKINPRLVRKQLPPDDDITRRNLLYRQLFTEFDKLDLQRRKEMVQAKADACAVESADIGAAPEAQSPPATSFNSSCASPPSNSDQQKVHKSVKYENRSRFGFQTLSRPKSSTRTSSEQRIFKSKSGHAISVTCPPSDFGGALAAAAEERPMSRRSTTLPKKTVVDRSNADSSDNSVSGAKCPFCEWSYSGDSGELDKHFWKSCPMLVKCPQCSQVLEVSALHSHLIKECDAKLNYIRCGRCTEVVHKDLYDIHSMETYCSELFDPKAAKCPLCHSHVTGINEGGWPKHLLTPGACPGNARRRNKH